MDVKNGHKKRRVDEATLAQAFRTMFKDMKSGRTVYLAFSRGSFHILIFTLAMSVIANIVLVDLLIRAPTVVERANTIIFIVQMSLSITGIIAALWLFFKGINIITER